MLDDISVAYSDQDELKFGQEWKTRMIMQTLITEYSVSQRVVLWGGNARIISKITCKAIPSSSEIWLQNSNGCHRSLTTCNRCSRMEETHDLS